MAVVDWRSKAASRCRKGGDAREGKKVEKGGARVAWAMRATAVESRRQGAGRTAITAGADVVDMGQVAGVPIAGVTDVAAAGVEPTGCGCS